MILMVNGMIHFFRPDTRLRMAGALNKQGRLLYFYGLGAVSGDRGASTCGTPWKNKRLPFPSWDGNCPRGIALASNNNNHDEYKFEARGNVEFMEQGTAS